MKLVMLVVLLLAVGCTSDEATAGTAQTDFSARTVVVNKWKRPSEKPNIEWHCYSFTVEGKSASNCIEGDQDITCWNEARIAEPLPDVCRTPAR